MSRCGKSANVLPSKIIPANSTQPTCTAERTGATWSSAKSEPQLLDASGAAGVAVGHERGGLPHEFGVHVVERVLEYGRDALVLLGGDEDEAVELADLPGPALRGLVLRKNVDR